MNQDEPDNSDCVGSWYQIKRSLIAREWWMVLDHLLHALEKLPVPDFVWEVKNWRARFCCWAVERYDEPPMHGSSSVVEALDR